MMTNLHEEIRECFPIGCTTKVRIYGLAERIGGRHLNDAVITATLIEPRGQVIPTGPIAFRPVPNMPGTYEADLTIPADLVEERIYHLIVIAKCRRRQIRLNIDRPARSVFA